MELDMLRSPLYRLPALTESGVNVIFSGNLWIFEADAEDLLKLEMKRLKLRLWLQQLKPQSE